MEGTVLVGAAEVEAGAAVVLVSEPPAVVLVSAAAVVLGVSACAVVEGAAVVSGAFVGAVVLSVPPLGVTAPKLISLPSLSTKRTSIFCVQDAHTKSIAATRSRERTLTMFFFIRIGPLSVISDAFRSVF